MTATMTLTRFLTALEQGGYGLTVDGERVRITPPPPPDLLAVCRAYRGDLLALAQAAVALPALRAWVADGTVDRLTYPLGHGPVRSLSALGLRRLVDLRGIEFERGRGLRRLAAAYGLLDAHAAITRALTEVVA